MKYICSVLALLGITVGFTCMIVGSVAAFPLILPALTYQYLTGKKVPGVKIERLRGRKS